MNFTGVFIIVVALTTISSDAQNLVFTNGNVTFEVDEASGICLCKDFKANSVTQTFTEVIGSLQSSIQSVNATAFSAIASVSGLDQRVSTIEASMSSSISEHLQIITQTGTTSFTVPPFAKRAVIQLYGAGGGGGPGQSLGSGYGRPGGSGAFCQVELTNLVPGTSQISISVGSGGSGATQNSDTASGNSGGATSLTFGGTTYSADGGIKGTSRDIQAAASFSAMCKIGRRGTVASLGLSNTLGGNTRAPGPYGGEGASYGQTTAGVFGGGGAPGYYYDSITVRDPATAGANGGAVIEWYPF